MMMAMLFRRAPGTWGLPTSWHGWVFLGLWAAATCAVFTGPPSAMSAAALVTLFVALLYVAARG